MSRVVPVITGVGLVTPLGAGVRGNWSALLAGKYVATHARVALPEGGQGDRVDRLAVMAAREACGQAGWEREREDAGTAVVVGTSKGGVESWIGAGGSSAHEFQTNRTGGSSGVVGLGHVANAVAREFGWTGAPCLTLSAACASGLHALARAALMLRAGEARRVLVVAAEASVHPLFVGSFKRLGVLPDEATGCRPFDEGRGGFVMSEAAAAVCLEAGDEASEPPAVAIDYVAIGADAYHLTGVDPEGRTTRRLLAGALAGGPVDLVHAHGTGTEANDPAELAAIEDCVGGVKDGSPPVLYSHKGAIGHSLGASGLVSVVLNCVAHAEGRVPGNVRTSRGLPARRVVLSREPVERAVRRSVVLAAGFGGAAGVARLRSV